MTELSGMYPAGCSAEKKLRNFCNSLALVWMSLLLLVCLHRGILVRLVMCVMVGHRKLKIEIIKRLAILF